MSVSLLCISLLALLVLLLAFRVSLLRGKTTSLYGFDTDPEDDLYKAVRAHGNATEYIPVLALLIYILGTMPLSIWGLGCILVVTVSRFLAAAGLLLPRTLAKPNILRLSGTLGTYLAGIGMCIDLLIRALHP